MKRHEHMDPARTIRAVRRGTAASTKVMRHAPTAPARRPPPAPPPPLELPSRNEQRVLDILLGADAALSPLQIVARSAGELSRNVIYKTLQRMPRGLVRLAWDRDTSRGTYSGSDIAPFYTLSADGRRAAGALVEARRAMSAADRAAVPPPARPRTVWDLMDAEDAAAGGEED